MECPYVFVEYLCNNWSEHTPEESNSYDCSCQYQNLPLGPICLRSNWFHYGYVSVREQLIITMKIATITTKVATSKIQVFTPIGFILAMCQWIITVRHIKFCLLTSTSSVWFHYRRRLHYPSFVHKRKCAQDQLKCDFSLILSKSFLK